MNKLKNLGIKILLVSSFTLVLNLSVYAQTTNEQPSTETPVVDNSVQEETQEEVQETQEESQEPNISFIHVDLDYEFLLTVDENGTILSAEAMTEEGTTTLESVQLIDSSITDGIQELLDVSTQDTEISLLITSDDDTMTSALSETLIASFGDVIEDYSTDEDSTDDDSTDEDSTDEGSTDEDSTDDDSTDDDSAGDDSTDDDSADDDSTDDDSDTNNNPVIVRIELARQLGISPGKMNLIQRLQKSFNDDDEIDYSYWANRPVKEIMKNIKSNKKSVVLNNNITKNKEEILEKEANEKSPIYNKIVKEIKQQFIDTIRNEKPNITNTKYTKQKSNKPEKHSSKNMKIKGNNNKKR